MIESFEPGVQLFLFSTKEALTTSADCNTMKDVLSEKAMLRLLSPDGYYLYLGITKPKPTDSDPIHNLDADLVKKNYRRLSRLHHPDRPTGDADTFRVLNRAQKVLLNSKLRQQYDLLGLDLDDEEEEHDDDNDNKDGDRGDHDVDVGTEAKSSSNSDNVMTQIASVILASIFQIIVRTVMMGLVSIFLVRYRITLIPSLLFLIFIAYRIHSIAQQNNTAASSSDLMSPIMIGVGLVLMYRGRTLDDPWSWTFWAGETLVMIMFVYNSIPEKNTAMATIVAFASTLSTLWLRGNLFKYATLVGLEVFVAIIAALAFPIMEMILEQILKEKMRKIGEKVRAHSQRLEAYHSSQKQNSTTSSNMNIFGGKESNSASANLD